MWLKKKITLENLQESNPLYDLEWLDWRFDGPKWMYTRSELSHYLVKRLQLEKAIVEEWGQNVLDDYNKLGLRYSVLS